MGEGGGRVESLCGGGVNVLERYISPFIVFCILLNKINILVDYLIYGCMRGSASPHHVSWQLVFLLFVFLSVLGCICGK